MKAAKPAGVAVTALLALTGCAAGTAGPAPSSAAPTTASAASEAGPSGSPAPGTAGITLPDRSTTVDSVEVTVTGVTADAAGAHATVTMDTHEGILDSDLSASTFAVAGAPAVKAAWQGDPPGSHHRSGRLDIPGITAEPGDDVTLTVAGLPESVVFTWTVPPNAPITH